METLYKIIAGFKGKPRYGKKLIPPSSPVLKEYLMPNLDPAAQKAAIKEAIQEWMNEQFAAFGRWTFYGLLVAAFAGAVYLALAGRGLVKV